MPRRYCDEIDNSFAAIAGDTNLAILFLSSLLLAVAVGIFELVAISKERTFTLD
jgi:hypothetical protein